MKLLGSLLLLFTLANDWIVYESKDLQFQLATPKELAEKVDTVRTALGDLYYHTLFTQTQPEEGNQVYMLSYCDYPEGTLHSDSLDFLDDFFKITIRSAMSSVRGELMYQADELIYGYPGRYWRIDYKAGQAVVKTRAFVVENRYYALQVVSTKARHINPDTDRFFKSFGLLEKIE